MTQPSNSARSRKRREAERYRQATEVVLEEFSQSRDNVSAWPLHCAAAYLAADVGTGEDATRGVSSAHARESASQI